MAIRLQWMPGHCDKGKNAADRLAKDVARPAKPIPFVHYCQGKLHASGAISLPSGSRNGGYPTVTYRRSTPRCQQPRQEGYMRACPGSRHTYWHNFASATIGYLPMLKHMTFSVTTGACVARKRRLPKCWWTVQGSGRFDGSYCTEWSGEEPWVCWEAQPKVSEVNHTSRTKTVTTVLYFAEATQRFSSRATQGKPNNGNDN